MRIFVLDNKEITGIIAITICHGEGEDSTAQITLSPETIIPEENLQWQIFYHNNLIFTGYLISINCTKTVIVKLSTNNTKFTLQEIPNFPEKVMFVNEYGQYLLTCGMYGDKIVHISQHSNISWGIEHTAPKTIRILAKKQSRVLQYIEEDISQKFSQAFTSNIINTTGDFNEELHLVENTMEKMGYLPKKWNLIETGKDDGLNWYIFTGFIGAVCCIDKSEECIITITNSSSDSTDHRDLYYPINDESIFKEAIDEAINKGLSYLNYYRRSKKFQFLCSIEDGYYLNTNCFVKISGLSGKIIRCKIVYSYNCSYIEVTAASFLGDIPQQDRAPCSLILQEIHKDSLVQKIIVSNDGISQQNNIEKKPVEIKFLLSDKNQLSEIKKYHPLAIEY